MRSIALACVIEMLIAGPAYAIDPFNTAEGLSKAQASRVLGVNESGELCTFNDLGNPLSLFEAISRTLCQSPKIREAWANVAQRAASVGAGEAAYWPNVTGAWQDQLEYSSTKVRDQPALSTSDQARIFNGSLNLGWVLYDFGRRDATVEGSRQLLVAAQANLDESLQQSFIRAAEDYYGVQSSQSSLKAALEVEANAKLSAEAAGIRVDKGVAPISDQLQAKTALAQAAFERAKAAGDLRARLGNLAIDMGLDPDSQLTLPNASENVATGPEFIQSVHALIDEAKHTHPSVVAAEHELAAALQNEQAARSQAYPSISLVSKSTWGDAPTIPGLGVNPVPASDRDSYVGIQVQVPLFDGFGHLYQARQAAAQSDVQRGALDDAKLQVAKGVWISYQTLTSDTANLSNVEDVLASAQKSYEASRQRYLGGAASILELLSAQTTLANAQREHIQALSEWQSARLQLAASLGRLGLWSLEESNSSTQQNK